MKHYLSRYPRNGRIAVLCEGDVAGYETELLELWTAKFPEVGLVDVWPCGTKTAIYGLSDAIGRAIELIVIEDRDYRSPSHASKDSVANRKDREKRGVRVRDWRTWKRNEIENYFIEPAVSVPVFAEVFRTTEDSVCEMLQTILTTTATDQALQYTLSMFRERIPTGERGVGGVSRKEGRPSWTEAGFVAPARERVEVLLAQVLEEFLEKCKPERLPQKEEFVQLFVAKSDEWKMVTIDDRSWRIDWAGKEVLYWLRVSMSGKLGWPSPGDTSVLEPVEWDKLSRDRYGEMDRTIERVMQPRLIKRLMDLVAAGAPEVAEVTEELSGLVAMLRTGMDE